MASLCQRCTGEDDARHEIDISRRGDNGSGPVSQPAKTKRARDASPQPKPESPTAGDRPRSPNSPKNESARAPNAQVIGAGKKIAAEPNTAPSPTSKSPSSAAEKTSKKKKKEDEYCLCFPYRARMEEDEAMQKACWCAYCCCMGIAMHKQPSPLQLRSHCTCIEQTWETQEVSSDAHPPWTCINTFCFCTILCLAPRRLGHPRCICFNEDCCGVVGGLKAAMNSNPDDRGLNAYDHALYEQFVPCYCCCCGVGMTPVFVSVMNSFSKCFCCMARISTGAPDFEECELCFNLLNCWCCLFHCRVIPELRKNPICAICGWRWKRWSSRPGGIDREEYVDSANEIHMDFPLGAESEDGRIPNAPGIAAARENPRERWRDVW